jgi:hypothetical protein
MSLPAINEMRKRIESCTNKPIQMYLKALYLFAARGIEIAGKVTASDLQTNPNHQIYGPRGIDAQLDETEPPDPSWIQVIKMLLKIQSGQISIDNAMEEAEKKIPVAVFKIKIAKQHLEPGEEAPARFIALPLVDEFEPWAKEMYEYFKAAGNNYVFPFSRQDVWEYITHKQRIFEGLNYKIKKYNYFKDILLDSESDSKGFKVLPHPRKLKGHGVRHWRVYELLKRYGFDDIDVAAFVGWVLQTGPEMMSTYADIREMWQRYIKKLCKVNSFQSNGAI